MCVVNLNSFDGLFKMKFNTDEVQFRHGHLK